MWLWDGWLEVNSVPLKNASPLTASASPRQAGAALLQNLLSLREPPRAGCVQTPRLGAVYKENHPFWERSPPPWRAIGWARRGPAPPAPSLWVPLKWANAPRSGGVRSLSRGAEMGSKGGPACGAGWDRGWGAAERDPDSLPPSRLGGCFLLVPDSPELQAEAGGGFGGVEGERGGSVGYPLPQDRALESKSRKAPSPSLGPRRRCHSGADGPTQLQAGPPPPREPKLSPRLGRPGPSPTRWRGPRGACRGGPCAWGWGCPALVKGRWEGAYREDTKGSQTPRRTVGMGQGLIGVRVRG